VCLKVPHVMLWPVLLVCCIAGAQSSSGTADMLLTAVNQVYASGGSYADKPPAEYIEWLHEVPARCEERFGSRAALTRLEHRLPCAVIWGGGGGNRSLFVQLYYTHNTSYAIGCNTSSC
jgi:hypothetical protein